MKKQVYHTKGRHELIKFFSQNPDRQFSVEEICLAINQSAERGKSSVYRHLNELCNEKAVRKFQSGNSNRSLYQYVGEHCDCGKHFHEKCLQCGKLSHLDCSDSINFAAHLLREHGFAVDCAQSILYGLCADCRAKEGGRT